MSLISHLIVLGLVGIDLFFGGELVGRFGALVSVNMLGEPRCYECGCDVTLRRDHRIARGLGLPEPPRARVLVQRGRRVANGSCRD